MYDIRRQVQGYFLYKLILAASWDQDAYYLIGTRNT
jgi:hypothetical protein